MQDSNSLMDLLTFKAVEEKVKKRVEKKARTFGQDVTLEVNAGKQQVTASDSECKVDPTVLSKLYDQWVMPLTKDVEVEYLLRRLDWLQIAANIMCDFQLCQCCVHAFYHAIFKASIELFGAM